MAIAALGLALYLMALGKWGKSLKAKNTSLGRRVLYGIVAAVPSLVASFYYGYGAYGSDIFIFILVWCTVVAILGFITVAYAPRWIVGAPKAVGNPTAK